MRSFTGRERQCGVTRLYLDLQAVSVPVYTPVEWENIIIGIEIANMLNMPKHFSLTQWYQNVTSNKHLAHAHPSMLLHAHAHAQRDTYN
jgi:hypothetical protein